MFCEEEIEYDTERIRKIEMNIGDMVKIRAGILKLDNIIDNIAHFIILPEKKQDTHKPVIDRKLVIENVL